MSSVQSTKTLGELFGLTDPKAKFVPFPVRDPGPLTPKFDAAYQFQQDHIRRLLLWVGGVAGRNLLISGPTGCGKSSLIEQLCARLGHELFRVPCHGKLEFSELVGQLTILENGATKFIHGPLPRAMLTGGILLLDEANFIHPSAIGGLNTVLDGGPLLIPETGELIQPHDGFRIVATGNSVDHGDDATLYKGLHRMNLAFIQRFCVIKADYLDKLDEVAMIHRAIPGLPGKVIEKMVQVAADVRGSFKQGGVESTISTRTLIKWGNVLAKRAAPLLAAPEDELKFALQFVLTDALKPEDAHAIEGVLQRLVSGMKLTQADFPPINAASTVAPMPPKTRAKGGRKSKAAQSVVTTTLQFLVNPNRQQGGHATFWVGVDPEPGASVGYTMNGQITPVPVVRAPVPDKSADEIDRVAREKMQTRGYVHISKIELPIAEVQDAVKDAVNALNQAIAAGQTKVTCETPDGCDIAIAIARQMNLSTEFFN